MLVDAKRTVFTNIFCVIIRDDNIPIASMKNKLGISNLAMRLVITFR